MLTGVLSEVSFRSNSRKKVPGHISRLPTYSNSFRTFSSRTGGICNCSEWMNNRKTYRSLRDGRRAWPAVWWRPGLVRRAASGTRSRGCKSPCRCRCSLSTSGARSHRSCPTARPASGCHDLWTKITVKFGEFLEVLSFCFYLLIYIFLG